MHKLNYNPAKCCICKKNIVYKFKNSKRTSIYPTTKGIYKLESYDVICKSCNLIYSNPEPTLQSQSRYYKSKFMNKKLIPDYNIKNQIEFIKKNISKNNSVLEIGSSNNFLINKLRLLGYKASGADVKSKTISKKFDLILINHMLEHISNPKKFLIRLKENLKKNGLLAIEVPNLLQYRLDNTLVLSAEHIYHFTEKTLRYLLEKSGYSFFYKERKCVSRKASIRLVFKNDESKKIIKPSKKDLTLNIINYQNELNKFKKLKNKYRNLASKLNNTPSNKIIYFWGYNTIFLNIFNFLNRPKKQGCKIVDQNFNKIVNFNFNKLTKKISNPNNSFADRKKKLVVICSLTWAKEIKKNLLKKKIENKNIIVPKF